MLHSSSDLVACVAFKMFHASSHKEEIEPSCLLYRSVPHQHVLPCLKSWVHHRPPPPPLPPLQPRTAPSTVVFPAAQAAVRHSVRGTHGSHPPRKNQHGQAMARISEGRNDWFILSFMNSLSPCYTGIQSTVSIEPGGLKITGFSFKGIYCKG